MYQTIYVDVDEEITSILDRIRQEQVMEIFLVVPKGAMLINSIINLKLLKKEAEKMGKNVTIVAPNDRRSQNIVERSGIKVEIYNEQSAKQLLNSSPPQQINKKQNVIEQASESAVNETKQQMENEDVNLGSTSFFGVNGGQTTQNNDVNLTNHKIDNNIVSTEEAKVYTPQFNQEGERSQNSMEQKEAKYFKQVPKENSFSQANEYDNKSKQSNPKAKFWLMVGVLLAIGIIGGLSWFFFNYPKLEVAIHPLNKSINKEIKFIVQDGVSDLEVDKKIIPGHYLEMSMEKTMEFKSSGSKIVDKNASKATGTVTIYNYFSEKPQPLIKTTRVLSKKSKKLFRLSKTVTVPGMKDGEPGKIEVAVYADKPGKDFNIEADEFTIEGFKSKPEKYKKFQVKSETAMSGGALSDDAKERKVITKLDLDRARKATIKDLDKSIIQEISKRLNSGKETVADSVVKEVVSSKASHLEGAVTDKFSYTIVYKIKLISFDKNDVRQIVQNIIEKELPENYTIDSDFKVNTKRGILDLDKKNLTVYADVSGLAWTKIDKNKLKETIAGMDTETTRQALNKKAGVQSAELKPSPTWIKKSPKQIDKIDIKVIKNAGDVAK